MGSSRGDDLCIQFLKMLMGKSEGKSKLGRSIGVVIVEASKLDLQYLSGVYWSAQQFSIMKVQCDFLWKISIKFLRS